MKTISYLLVGILLLVSCRQLPDFFKTSRKSRSPGPSLPGTYELIIYKGIDHLGRIHYPYNEKVKGIAIFDETEKFVIQLYDATRPYLSNSDPFFCSDPEIRIAFLSEKSFFGHYQFDGDTIALRFEGANLPNLTNKVEKRYYELQGDSLLIIGPARMHNGISLAEHSTWIRCRAKDENSRISFGSKLKRKFSK
jgi:hypothetical protein